LFADALRGHETPVDVKTRDLLGLRDTGDVIPVLGRRGRPTAHEGDLGLLLHDPPVIGVGDHVVIRVLDLLLELIVGVAVAARTGGEATPAATAAPEARAVRRVIARMGIVLS